MFNDIVTIVVCIGLFGLLLLVLYVAGRMTGVIASHEVMPDQTELDEDEDDFDPDEDWDEEDEDEDYEDDYARDIEDVPLPDDTLTGRDHIAVLEMRRALMRAENPRLYQDDWYEISRREFSIKMVEQYQLQSDFRREMGLAA